MPANPPVRDTAWPIGRLSRQTGVNIETIRYYERIGMLPSPPRTEGGRRVYDEAATRRLAFVRRCRELGFSLDEARALLALGEAEQTSCAEVKAIAIAHLADVRGKLADLVKLEDILAKTVSQCSGEISSSCPVLDILDSERFSQTQ